MTPPLSSGKDFPLDMNAAGKTPRCHLARSMPAEASPTDDFQSIPSIGLCDALFVPLSKSLGIFQNFAPCSGDLHQDDEDRAGDAKREARVLPNLPAPVQADLAQK